MALPDKTRFFLVCLFLLLSLQIPAQGENKRQTSPAPGSGSGTAETVFGFGILRRLPGLWNGPVSSNTPAGNFENWYVDFRPVAPGQVSRYSTLDAQTLNYLSFFIVRHNKQLEVALRTEGVFRNKGCVTYEVADTVQEKEGYYRFPDFQAGDKRAYTQFTFRGAQLQVEVYTNKFNTVSPLRLHSRWTAERADQAAAEEAVTFFRFPRPEMVKDFSDVFMHMQKNIYFTFEHDPYSSSSQPYVGRITVNISIAETLPVKNTHELFLLLTNTALFKGLKYNRENLKYISRYAYLPVTTRSY